MPRADTQAMSAHLTEIARTVEPGAHAVVILDRAGWHTSSTLQVPHNITLLPLPPRAPELNPVENVWQFMRDNWLSNRVFRRLRRHPRSLLPCLEQSRLTARTYCLYRNPKMGPWVLNKGRWYKSFALYATYGG